jgi:YtkA-like
MRSAAGAMIMIAAIVLCTPQAAHTQVRAKADVGCQPAAEKLQYDCTIRLANSRTNEPLTGITLMVGADMPSMPAAHNVRPVAASEDADKGTYRASITLEMYGDWALRLDLAGAVRDRVIKLLRFESDRVDEAPPAPAPKRHRH